VSTQVTPEFDARVEMKAFIDRSRAPYPEWCAGIAAEPDERLSEHGVREDDWWIVRRLGSAEKALHVEEFLRKLGCDGDGDGGSDGSDEASTGVYAYWKREHTTP
jgi:hypothetical protein